MTSPYFPWFPVYIELTSKGAGKERAKSSLQLGSNTSSITDGPTISPQPILLPHICLPNN